MVKVLKKTFRKFVEKVAPVVKKINDEYIKKSNNYFLKRQSQSQSSEFIKGSIVWWGSLPDKDNDPFLGKDLRYPLIERMRRKNPLLIESYRVLKAQGNNSRLEALWRQILNEDNWDSLVITLKQTLENAGNQHRLLELSKVLDVIKDKRQSYNDIVQLYNILHPEHPTKYYDYVNGVYILTRPC